MVEKAFKNILTVSHVGLAVWVVVCALAGCRSATAPLHISTATPGGVIASTPTHMPSPTSTYTVTPTPTPLSTATLTPTKTTADLGAGQLQVTEITTITLGFEVFEPNPLGGTSVGLTWSLDGTRLAVAFGYSVIVANADGSNPHKLWDTPADVLGSGVDGFGWSPDGKLLAYASPKGQEYAFSEYWYPMDIWIIGADGQDDRQLTHEAGEDDPTGLKFLDWSPDGRQMLVYSIHKGGVGVITAEKYDQVEIIAYNRFYASPGELIAHYGVWSPDGQKFLLASDGRLYDDLPEIIWTLDADGSNPTVLRESWDLFMVRPQWSPDGSKIVWEERKVTSGNNQVRLFSDVWVMNVDGSDATKLISAQEVTGRADTKITNVVWVPPEGKQIAVTIEGDENIYLLTLGERQSGE